MAVGRDPAFSDRFAAFPSGVEYWFHAASYLPMQDFRYTLPQKLYVKQGKSRYYNADPKVMQFVMDTIRGEGPKKARDFNPALPAFALKDGMVKVPNQPGLGMEVDETMIKKYKL